MLHASNDHRLKLFDWLLLEALVDIIVFFPDMEKFLVLKEVLFDLSGDKSL